MAVPIVALTLGLTGCSGQDEAPTEPGDGTTPTLTVVDQTGVEGYGAIFVVRLSEACDSPVIYQFKTVDSSAVGGQDFTPITDSLDTIPIGGISTFITVQTTDDAEWEQTEHFLLVISNLAGATSSDSTATGTILDNDATWSGASGIKTILDGNCALTGCHGLVTSGGFTMGQVGNAVYDSVRTAVGWHGQVVIVGASNSSSLYVKATADYGYGSRMPPAMDTLPMTDQLKIRDWIDQGAEDN
ncbi:MAG: hypothetical protein JSU65_11065 [Candidatus Zixiibacteriota bacterium]|nr:MAG: hypothetical protein JSU65_11065 [candidate division Zixibacteria bacterium]